MSNNPPLPTKTFDFSALTVTWQGVPLTGGLESVKMSRAEDSFTVHVSGDGTVTRALNSNKMGGIELTFGQNATALDYLSQQALLDASNGTAIGAIEVKDPRGTTVGSAPNAWIKKVSDAGFQKEVETRVWNFECDQLTLFVGGLA